MSVRSNLVTSRNEYHLMAHLQEFLDLEARVSHDEEEEEEEEEQLSKSHEMVHSTRCLQICFIQATFSTMMRRQVMGWVMLHMCALRVRWYRIWKTKQD